MNALRPIEIASYAGIETPSTFGHPPQLKWLPLSRLAIDGEYQREITSAGRKNVRLIASNFKWSMFTPVIVAPSGDGRFAIVDGQHRATAAALCGIEQVPCYVIEANTASQAAAFRAINGNTTRMHTVQLFRASLAAGDPEAARVSALCARAGVTIMRNPTAANFLKRGETIAVGTIGKALERFGEETAEIGLKAIVATDDDGLGMLNRTIIWGVIEVLHDHREWRDAGPRLIEAITDVDLEHAWRQACTAASQRRGVSTLDLFESALVEHLGKFFAIRAVKGAGRG